MVIDSKSRLLHHVLIQDAFKSVVIKISYNELKNSEVYCLSFFFLLFILFGISGKWNDISAYQLIIQLLFALLSYFYIKNRGIINTNQFFINTFLFQFSLAIILKLMFIFFEDCEFGPSAIDSIGYFDYGNKGSKMTIAGYTRMLSYTSWGGIDDRGYLFYLRWLHFLLPKGIVPFVVIFFNAVFIGIASMALYKSLILLSPYNRRNAIAVTCIFSSFLPSVNTSAVGMKEDVFIPIIILALYYYIRYIKNKQLHNFFLCVFFTFLTVFFRTAITASLIVVFIIGLVSSKNNKKFVVYSFYIALIVSPIIIDFIITNFLGISLEGVLEIAQGRNKHTTGADPGAKAIGSIIASIIGPFPTFVDSHDTMFYSFSSVVKMIFNFPVIYAIIRILKKYDYKYYFVAFLYLIGIMFNVVVGTGLDMRYQMPFFGAFLILLFYQLNNIKIKPIIFLGYGAACVSIAFVYNMIK